MTRISEEDYRSFIKRLQKNGRRLDIEEPPRPSKYHNIKSEYYDPDLKQSITFDSKKELEYYLLLKDRERRGEVFNINRQVNIEIQPPFTDSTGKKHRAITYRADFTFIEAKKLDDKKEIAYKIRYIDVKGVKTEVYKLKKKLLAYKGILIEEV